MEVRKRQENVAQVAPLGLAGIAEAYSFLWWEIDHDEAIGTGSPGIFHKLLLSIGQDGIVVAHKHDRSSQTTLSRILDHLQDHSRVDTILEGNGV